MIDNQQFERNQRLLKNWSNIFIVLGGILVLITFVSLIIIFSTTKRLLEDNLLLLINMTPTLLLGIGCFFITTIIDSLIEHRLNVHMTRISNDEILKYMVTINEKIDINEHETQH